MTWCAICLVDLPNGGTLEPLGKDGALVSVCHDCNEAHPRSGRYTFDGGRQTTEPNSRLVGDRRGGYSLGNGNSRRGKP